jgi:phosphatidate cytidylyltransferase
MDWITRPIFGVALAAVAIGSIFAGTWPMAVMAGVASVAGAREWHRMVESRKPAREFWITAFMIPISLAVLAWLPESPNAWFVLSAATLLVAASAAIRNTRVIWHAGGVLYLGVPALLMVLMRARAPNAICLLLELFIVVWATDTGALVLGNLIGGPKLVPVLSPNKTWAGTLGGMIAASIGAAIFVALLHGRPIEAAAFAALLSAVAHGGDLFESWVKRQFQFKDSGGLIPGHGGALDRLDSTLAASTAMAFAVFAIGVDPTFGAHL